MTLSTVRLRHNKVELALHHLRDGDGRPTRPTAWTWSSTA